LAYRSQAQAAEVTDIAAFEPRILSGVADVIDRDDLIHERAYQIWQERGQPDGSPEDHWFTGEQELADEADQSKEPAEGAA
jgi:hypothetical protein